MEEQLKHEHKHEHHEGCCVDKKGGCLCHRLPLWSMIIIKIVIVIVIFCAGVGLGSRFARFDNYGRINGNRFNSGYQLNGRGLNGGCGMMNGRLGQPLDQETQVQPDQLNTTTPNAGSGQVVVPTVK